MASPNGVTASPSGVRAAEVVAAREAMTLSSAAGRSAVRACQCFGEETLDKSIGRMGRADDIRCQESGDNADSHHDGIEMRTSDAETLTERGDDEGKFSDLRERKTALHGAL